MGKIVKMGTIRRKKVVDMDTGAEMDDITPMDIFVSGPSGDKPADLTKEDVWGKYDEFFKKVSNGMVVASSGEVCPVFGDVVPYKSVTVICNEKQQSQVTYWLEYVHGANCVSKTKHLDDGKIAIRSDYKCW